MGIEKAFADGWTVDDMEAAIRRDRPAELLHVPVWVALDPPDCGWAMGVCLRLSRHPHSNVRGNAILGFGHLARTCGVLDRTAIQPIIEAAIQDSDAYVRGQANAAADDLEHFLGWHLRRAAE